MPFNATSQKVDKITSVPVTLDNDEIRLDALSCDTPDTTSGLHYVGNFSEDKTQFQGKRIKFNQEFIETYTGIFLVTTVDGAMGFSPPVEPTNAKMEKIYVDVSKGSKEHEGVFLNRQPHGNGIEAKVIPLTHGVYSHRTTGYFINGQTVGPYEKQTRSEETIDLNHELIERVILVRDAPFEEENAVFGSVHQTKTTTSTQKKEIVITIQEGFFKCIVDDNECEDCFVLTKGHYTRNNSDGSYVRYEGLFSTENCTTLMLNNIHAHDIKCTSKRALNEEIYQYKEGFFQKSSLREGLFLTKFNSPPDNIISCYEGKFDAHEIADDLNGLLCQYNGNTDTFIVFQNIVNPPNYKSWLVIEFDKKSLRSITAVSNPVPAVYIIKGKTSPDGTLVESVQFITPKAIQQHWKMNRNEYGQWTYVAGNALKELAVTQDKKLLWARIEKMAISMERAESFVPQVKAAGAPKLLTEQDSARKNAEALLLEEEALKKKKKSQKKTSVNEKKPTQKPSAPSIKKTSTKSEQLPQEEIEVFDDVKKTVHVAPFAIFEEEDELSVVFQQEPTIETSGLESPTHYPSPLAVIERPSSLLPGQIRTPFMAPPTPVESWTIEV